ncbi:zeta toxin family protein [Bacteroides sp. 224]|uniref:zeta toxin family protein n=1 Tax=Bacteroides sp. 224 TaxID=2302936 RepID=UPI0013D645FF|nr:zeta toxin family protein [Bacteroides sp. 224]NDV67157.1 zeta toxin [Bacteroides sp. 224]
MPNLYIVSGPNGAGKTTASFTVLPEMLNCREFVNADEIARGLSPFNPESVAIEAGRLMLTRIHELMNCGIDFALETTLATRSYISFIRKAQKLGYVVTLVYFWLDSPALAAERVEQRVASGGHNISKEIIYRRYISGICNLFSLYIKAVDSWMIFNNSYTPSELIAEGTCSETVILNHETYNIIERWTTKKEQNS